MTDQITYTRNATTARGQRIWIEGAKLSVAGFKRGTRYTKHASSGKIILVRDDEGPFKVSGRKRNNIDIPIIDLTAQEFNGIPPEAKIRVVFTQNKIFIKLHQDEANQMSREKSFVKRMAGGMLREASLFTGGGISTAAIHEAIKDEGLSSKVCWVTDQELKYLQVAGSNNFAIDDDTTFIVGDIEDAYSSDFTNCDILSFSMPCAGFSRAGKSKHGLSSESHSGSTLFGVISAIRHANPAVLISENVVEAQHSPIYTLLKSRLRQLGYTCYEQILDSTHTGTFENRKRYWMVAISNGLAETIKHLDDLSLNTLAQHSQIRLSELLDCMVDDAAWSDNQYLKDKQERDLAAKKGFAKRQLLQGDETYCGTIGRHYNKRRSTEPFLTREDGKERLFTVREHSRIKNVPELLCENIGATVGHEILGQSVDYKQPYLLVRRLIQTLKEALWFEYTPPVTTAAV